MRILFVNPPSPDGYTYIRDINRSGRRSKENTIWPQTSLAMLASVFPKHETRIYDCIAEHISYAKLLELMQDFKPDWVVFNPVSSTFTHDCIVAHYAKSLGAKTVSISPHTKALREKSLERFKCLDYAVDYTKGETEPEYNLRELITGESAKGTRFEDLPPARQDLLPISRYNLPFIGRGYTFVITSRGCPWKCIYCRQTVMNESKVRFRPVEAVIKEIVLNNLHNIAFHADTATMNKKWIYDFCKEVKARQLRLRWVCNSRVDTIDLEMLKEMKSAGCWMICYGVESGDDKVLAMNKKEATVEQAKQAVRWAKEAGLKVWTYMMIAMYGDTVETINKTIDFACELNADICNFAISAPYPGTEYGNIVETNGWLKDSSWEKYDQNYSAQVDLPGCPRETVIKLQKKAYLKWYISWRGIRFLINGFKLNFIPYFIKTINDHLR